MSGTTLAPVTEEMRASLEARLAALEHARALVGLRGVA
jgi:hypothetical protein